MAILFPKRLPSRSTKGERIVIGKLNTSLDNTHSLYYEPKVSSVRPDVLIIGENLGILVLEVKDWKMENLSQLEGDKWKFSDGTYANSPYLQGRNYSFSVSNLLKKDPLLSTDKGRLKFSYGYGVIFTNITRLEFIMNSLDEHYDLNLTLFKDDLEAMADVDLFEALMGMLPFSNVERITEELRDRIRYHLFPEIRIGEEVRYSDTKLSSFKSLKVMDQYQELMAREIHSGHRMLRGVAGSGKTIILVGRAKMIVDEDPKAKVLICCYSVTLVAYIKSLLGKDYIKKVQVKTFHELLASSYQLYDAGNLESLVDLIESEIVYRVMYNSILVDEGQDMEPSWIKFLYDSCRGEEKSFLFCMDKAQTVFKNSILTETGIDFRGRSEVLRINYRNPKVVMDLAWKYYQYYLKDSTKDPDIIDPKSLTNRRGKVKVSKFDSFDDEVAFVTKTLLKMESYSDVAIVYRVARLKESYLEKLMSSLNKFSIPFEWVSQDRKAKSGYEHSSNSVKLVTVESSKGLTFSVVFFVGFTTVHRDSLDELDKQVKLGYIGMTRSTKVLSVTYHESNLLEEGLLQMI